MSGPSCLVQTPDFTDWPDFTEMSYFTEIRYLNWLVCLT